MSVPPDTRQPLGERIEALVANAPKLSAAAFILGALPLLIEADNRIAELEDEIEEAEARASRHYASAGDGPT